MSIDISTVSNVKQLSQGERPSNQSSYTINNPVDKSPKKTNDMPEKNPVTSVYVGFSKSVAQDKRLADLADKLSNIDEKIIRDFAHHLNGVHGGTIITDAIIEKAIKGLNSDHDKLPPLVEESPEFSKIDDIIMQTTQKMLALNSASLVVNPNMILKDDGKDIAALPIPIFTSHEKKINEIFTNEDKFAQDSKSLLPQMAQTIFSTNYPLLQEINLDNPMQEQLQKIKTASVEDNTKINNDIVDNVKNIYQMLTIRILAQLGSVPSAMPTPNSIHGNNTKYNIPNGTAVRAG